MITIALILNIIVLTPFCFLILVNNSRIEKVLGSLTPARSILLAIYITILISSLLLVIFPNKTLIFGLLSMQIFYKLLATLTVRDFKNPVIISNVIIAIFHSIALYVSYQP